MPRSDIRGRFQTNPMSGGMITKPMGDRHYDVQQYTGYATSTVAKGQWSRGQIIRHSAPAFRPPGRNLFMYDPTNPATWRTTSL